MTALIRARIAAMTDDELRSEWVSAARNRDRDVLDAFVADICVEEATQRALPLKGRTDTLVAALLQDMRGF